MLRARRGAPPRPGTSARERFSPRRQAIDWELNRAVREWARASIHATNVWSKSSGSSSDGKRALRSRFVRRPANRPIGTIFDGAAQRSLHTPWRLRPRDERRDDGSAASPPARVGRDRSGPRPSTTSPGSGDRRPNTQTTMDCGGSRPTLRCRSVMGARRDRFGWPPTSI